MEGKKKKKNEKIGETRGTDKIEKWSKVSNGTENVCGGRGGNLVCERNCQKFALWLVVARGRV